MSDVVVVASNAAYRFGGDFGVVNVDLVLRRGRISGFLGRNGAGKSTTMRLLAGVCIPTHGKVVVVVDGVECAAHSSVARRQIGWALEEPAVHAGLMVGEQLRLSKRVRGGNDDVDEVMAALDLQGVQGKLCGSLSKGFRQRVGLAQALLTRASVLLLDEPTAGLDPAQVVALRTLLVQRRDEGAAILWSSHITAEIEAVADDVVVISDGRTVHHGDQTTLASALQALTAGTHSAAST